MTDAPHEGWHWRIWAAEAAGTALLMLGGLSVVTIDFGNGSAIARALPSESVALLLTGLLFACCVALIAISPLGRLSGAHLNPAVTLGFRMMGEVGNRDLVGYLAAQFAGALAGALLVRALWGPIATSIDGGVTRSTIAPAAAIALEAGMTAILIATIFLFVSRERLARWTPLAIVPVIAVLVWKGSPYTGTSLNPARSAGPAIAFSTFSDLWLYLVGPALGAIAISLLWKLRPSMAEPKTAKLYHDPRYVCSFASALPAVPCDAPDSGSATVPNAAAGPLV